VSNTAQPPLPTPQEAYDNLFQGVHSRVFFAKCASAGIRPGNADEAAWMLEMAGKLRQVSEAPAVKQAAAESSIFFQMNRDLDTVLAKQGFDVGGRRAAPAELGIKQAAQTLASDPLFYNSVLALKAEEADEVRKQLAR
jgi:hypothetical protein